VSVPLLFWDVDTQVDFMSPEGALYVPDAEVLTENLARLTRTAEAMSIPVIADADDHEWSDEEISSDPDFQTTFPPHCMRGTQGAERIPETTLDWTLEVGHEQLASDEIRYGLEQPHPRVLIYKKQLDIFSNPNTDIILEMLAPASVVVYGVAFDFCNRKVVDGLLERGQTGIVVVTDATKPIYPENVGPMLEGWEAQGVTLRTTEQLLADLEQAGAPQLAVRQAVAQDRND
jgi:nicotinamidase/pyrazinamidase